MLRPKQTTAPLTSIKPKKPERSAYWWLRWIPAVVLTIVLLDLIYIVGSVAIVPVLVSFALAYLLNPAVQELERRGISRPLAAAASLVGVLLILAGFLFFIIPQLEIGRAHV
jgi:predicted PurR-regulated permease PerM